MVCSNTVRIRHYRHNKVAFNMTNNSKITTGNNVLCDLSHLNVLCDLSHWGLLEISGADAVTFLQGQVTNDVKLLAGSETRSSAHYPAAPSPVRRGPQRAGFGPKNAPVPLLSEAKNPCVSFPPQSTYSAKDRQNRTVQWPLPLLQSGLALQTH